MIEKELEIIEERERLHKLLNIEELMEELDEYVTDSNPSKDSYRLLQKNMVNCFRESDDDAHKIKVLKEILKYFQSDTLYNEGHSYDNTSGDARCWVVFLQPHRYYLRKIPKYMLFWSSEDPTNYLVFSEVYREVKTLVQSSLDSDHELKELWDYNLKSYGRILMKYLAHAFWRPRSEKHTPSPEEPEFKAMYSLICHGGYKYSVFEDVYIEEERKLLSRFHITNGEKLLIILKQNTKSNWLKCYNYKTDSETDPIKVGLTNELSLIPNDDPLHSEISKELQILNEKSDNHHKNIQFQKKMDTVKKIVGIVIILIVLSLMLLS